MESIKLRGGISGYLTIRQGDLELWYGGLQRKSERIIDRKENRGKSIGRYVWSVLDKSAGGMNLRKNNFFDPFHVQLT